MKLPTPPIPTALPTALMNNTLIKNLAAKSLASMPVIIRLLPPPPHFIQKFVVEKALNRTLAEQIEMGDFDFLQDHCLKLSVKDLGLDFYLGYDTGKLLLLRDNTPVDVHFSGNSQELILLASRLEDPDTFFFQRRLTIEGDTELGLYIKNIIDSVDYDSWPKWLNSLLLTIAELIEIENQSSQQQEKVILTNA